MNLSETLLAPAGAPDPLEQEGFGDRQTRLRRAIESLKAGKGVVVMDDADRENEGDLIFDARTLSVEQMAVLIREGSGIVCLVLTSEDCDRLHLPPMVTYNQSRFGTAFTVSIEARQGVTTGVSAADRVCTVRAAAAPDSKPEDLSRPGHVFPLRAHPEGLGARNGHTEATLDLLRRAGLYPAGVLCELMNPDGTMARLPELARFARQHGVPIVTIADLLRL